jgi:transcription initiation factor TFIIIB Brf1 subunit/transcription initiation factor TFIIB
MDLYPEKTLELFKKAINEYAEKNIGRSYYEYIAKLLKQMLKIKNGNQTVAEIVSNYRIKYKNRRVMIEILSSF